MWKKKINIRDFIQYCLFYLIESDATILVRRTIFTYLSFCACAQLTTINMARQKK